MAVGGGERSRGETGQRGLSFKCSAVTGDLWGVATRAVASVLTRPRLGVVQEDILPAAGALGVLVFDDVRCGLVSCELFLRDLVLPVVEAALGAPGRVAWRPGEVSREARGEDLEVDVCVAG